MLSNQQTKQEVIAVYTAVAGQEKDALSFLIRFDQYFESIESFIARPDKNAKDFIHLLANTNLLYSMPFYVRNAPFLHVPVMQALIGFADGLAWHNQDGWKKQWAETSSLALVEVVTAVATLTVGFDAARTLSPRLKEVAWASRKVQP